MDEQTRANPIIPVQAADPHADILNGKDFVYATGAGKTENGFAATVPHRFAWRAAAAGFHRVIARDWIACALPCKYLQGTFTCSTLSL